MAEVFFYHLTATPLEQTLPWLVEKALARDWSVLIRCGSEAGLSSLDALLWIFRDESFLPHGLASDPNAARQPVCLTLSDGNANGADVLMLVDGARVAPEEPHGYRRVCLMFDGNDAAALDVARADWRACGKAGLAATYWAQDGGRWVQRATSAEPPSS